MSLRGGGKSLLAGALLGGIGGIVGAFVGYGVRRRLAISTLRISWLPFAKISLRSAWRYFLFRGNAKILLRTSKRIDSVPSTCL